MKNHDVQIELEYNVPRKLYTWIVMKTPTTYATPFFQSLDATSSRVAKFHSAAKTA